MTDTPGLHRDLGRHDAQIEALERDIQRLTQVVDAMDTKLGEIHTTLAEAKGGWRVLLAVGGIAGTLGAGLAKAVTYFWGDR
jgi:hypothetical protein